MTGYFSFAIPELALVAVYLIFRLIGGFCGSAFLSVAGGSVSDLFDDKSVAKYVLLFVKILPA